MSERERTILSKEDAIKMLPDGENIHTFRNSTMMLIGADWSRDDIMRSIGFQDCLELLLPLVEACNHIQSCNKNDGNAPKDNQGPHSRAYWQWQEEQSRDIAYKALQELREKLK